MLFNTAVCYLDGTDYSLIVTVRACGGGGGGGGVPVRRKSVECRTPLPHSPSARCQQTLNSARCSADGRPSMKRWEKARMSHRSFGPWRAPYTRNSTNFPASRSRITSTRSTSKRHHFLKEII